MAFLEQLSCFEPHLQRQLLESKLPRRFKLAPHYCELVQLFLRQAQLYFQLEYFQLEEELTQ